MKTITHGQIADGQPVDPLAAADAPPPAAMPAAVTVGGGSQYTTIQQGIQAAEQAGSHTVLVMAGTYTENDLVGAADNGLTITAASAGVTLDGSIGISGAANITISGLTFQGDGSGVALTALNSQTLDITGNSFIGTGEAVVLDGTTSSRVTGNVMTTTTASAIEAKNGADGNTLDRNVINGDGAQNTVGAIWLHGSNNGTITHNQITNTTGAAISLTDFYAPGTTATQNNNNLIAYNSLDQVDTASNDSGAIYILGRSQDPQTNIVVEYNFIGATGSAGIANPHAVGIYLDDNASGVSVTQNIVQASAGMTDPYQIHGGSNDTFSGNIFDLGSGATDFGLFQADASDQQPQGTFQQLQNDVVAGNVFTTESTSPHDPGFADLTGGVGTIDIRGNDFWSYSGAPLNVSGSGATGDTDPHYVQPAATPARSLSAYSKYSGDGIEFAPIDTSMIGTATACYAGGTRIATPGGDVAIEALAAGDRVLTRAGEAAVVWIGRRRVDLRASPGAAPILIRAGALADGVPRRDLCVSPEHGMALDGYIVAAHLLLNGVTIERAPADGEVEYFHVELPSHDILLAEGAWSESWLDTGNRAMFENAATGFESTDSAGVRPERAWPERTRSERAWSERAWSERACAPSLRDGPILDALRARLAARAGLPPDLVLTLDAPGLHRLVVPAGVSAVLLASASGTHPGDARRLGAVITSVALDRASLALNHPAIGFGFHPVESNADGAWRWTNGRGRLELDAADIARTLEVHVNQIHRAA